GQARANSTHKVRAHSRPQAAEEPPGQARMVVQDDPMSFAIQELHIALHIANGKAADNQRDFQAAARSAVVQTMASPMNRMSARDRSAASACPGPQASSTTIGMKPRSAP